MLGARKVAKRRVRETIPQLPCCSPDTRLAARRDAAGASCGKRYAVQTEEDIRGPDARKDRARRHDGMRSQVKPGRREAAACMGRLFYNANEIFASVFHLTHHAGQSQTRIRPAVVKLPI